MKTREESLNNFYNLMDKLINSKYLLASAQVYEVLSAINSSKLLSDMFGYFSDGFDFEEALTSAFYIEGEEKHFVLPENNAEILAFVYNVLKELNYKRLQLTDVLDFFEGGKNYDVSYQNFAKEMLEPFKIYTYQIGMQMINETVSNNSEEVTVEEPVTVQEQPIENNIDKQPKFSIVSNKTDDYATLRRLIDLDKLAISQSRLSEDEKEELRYVLNVFEEEIKGGDKEKMKLSYLAYYYAMRPLKKIKNNVKAITEIFINQELL